MKRLECRKQRPQLHRLLSLAAPHHQRAPHLSAQLDSSLTQCGLRNAAKFDSSPEPPPTVTHTEPHRLPRPCPLQLRLPWPLQRRGSRQTEAKPECDSDDNTARSLPSVLRHRQPPYHRRYIFVSRGLHLLDGLRRPQRSNSSSCTDGKSSRRAPAPGLRALPRQSSIGCL